MLKLPLKTKAFNRKHGTPWSSCAPFVDNAQALLLHRPRYVTIYRSLGEPHLAVHMWCGSGQCGTDKFTFIDSYDGSKLLCKRCEENAVKQGLPSADELLGKHIHLGKIVAQQVCCIPSEVKP